MPERKELSTDDALNKLSLVAHALRFLAFQQEGSDQGALLQLLNTTLTECLLALDSPSSQ